MNYYEVLKLNDIERLVKDSIEKKNKKFNSKVKRLRIQIEKKIKLKSYIINNSSVNIFEKIIRTCLVDKNLSGVTKTQAGEILSYKRINQNIQIVINDNEMENINIS